jgi:hypothetical protein
LFDMSKIEKTLELNITHEILSLADSFWWYLQPVSLKRYWRPYTRFPLISGPKSFATGLHINLEGRKGGGYDVCINSPSNFQGGSPRLLFMQFKAGTEQAFCTDSKSIFYGDAMKPSVHVEFEINNNGKRNQHRLLTDLAAKAGNKDAVLYVFPRIVNEVQLMANVGRLLGKTSFISLSDIDAKAALAGVTIDDGRPHKFRTCYHEYYKNEVNFFFFFFGMPNTVGGYHGEIFAIRMYRALVALRSTQVQDSPIAVRHVMDAMVRHVLTIADHLMVPLSTTRRLMSDYWFFESSFGRKNGEEVAGTIDDEADQIIDLLRDILNGCSVYFKWVQNLEYFNKDTFIPEPPDRFTIPVNNNGIRLSFELEDPSVIQDLSDITYQLF